MFGVPMPWLILAAVVAVTLYLKGYVGYVRPPGLPKPRLTPPGSPPPVPGTTYGSAAPNEAHLLERMDSHTLGVYFALAVRRDAEASLAHRIALRAGESIEAAFTAPFSPPPPAGPDGGQPPAAPQP